MNNKNAKDTRQSIFDASGWGTENCGRIIPLVTIHTRQQLAVANPIYREVIPHTLTWTTQVLISEEIAAFQQFFRGNGDS